MTTNSALRRIGTAVTVVGLFLGSTALASAATGQPVQPLDAAGQTTELAAALSATPTTTAAPHPAVLQPAESPL